MPRIIPIKELRNTTEISELCHKHNEPIFITKNGYGDMVIMSIETYERQFALVDVYQKLSEAEKQLEQSDAIDAQAASNNMRERLPIKTST